SPQPPAQRPAFVLSRTGSLVFISDKTFKLAKLRPPASKALAEDQNFRVAHQRFAGEPVFLYFNVQLEDKNRPNSQPAQITAEAEAERVRQEAEAERVRVEEEAERTRKDEENKAEVEIQKN